MATFSTRQAAKKLGIDMSTLLRHIRLGKVSAPKSATSGGMTIHFWTEEEIEHVREMLPKIANGRKTRHKKKQSGKSKGAQARAPMLQKKKRKKK